MTDNERSHILNDVADAILAHQNALLEANGDDLSRMDSANPLYDRLKLTAKRLEDIAADMRHVAALPSPLGRKLQERTLPNGLLLRKVSVPFGVIGIIYEARPNVTFDVFALCLKSGNVCLLKGGHDADASNRAAVKLIRGVLQEHNVTPHCVTLLPASHEATAALLNAIGYVDLCIPRGGKKLISFVRQNAHVPVIETGAGVVNTYFDEHGNAEMGARIICNAKTRRVSVCNALDCLLLNQRRPPALPTPCKPLQ